MTRAVSWLAAAVAISAEIPYPLFDAGPRRTLTVVAVLAFATACLAHAHRRGGAARAAGMLAATAGIGWGFEVLGVHTGVPFGTYRYGGGLGPRLVGVPALVPLAWTMVCYPSFLAAGRLAGRHGHRQSVITLAGTAVAAAGWDLFVDPQLVAAGGWRWAGPGPLWPGSGGVPLVNTGGWLLAGLVVALALRLVSEPPAPAVPAVPRRGDGAPLLLFGWAYFSGVLANLAFFGRPWVALWGGAVMGLVALPLAAPRLLPRAAPAW